MTIYAILFGLLPIMWSPTLQSGADVMKRIAAPMIGGVITSGILELLLYPVIYVIWRKRHLGSALARPSVAFAPIVATAPAESGSLRVATEPKPASAAPAEPLSSEETPPPRRGRLWLFVVLLLSVALGVGGFFAWQKFGPVGSVGAAGSGQAFATQKVKDLTVNFIHPK